MEETLDLLQDVLEYELSCAERHRRYVSLVMVAEGMDYAGQLTQTIEEKVRASDLMAKKDSSLCILMSETDQEGAIKAIDRFRDRDAGDFDLRFSLATYPGDSGGAEKLLSTVQRRLNLAQTSQAGAVVTSG